MSRHQTSADISYVIDGAENSENILLLHGWGCDSRFLEKQRLHFAKRYRALVPDIPGFGTSKAVIEPTVSSIAEALVRSLAELGVEEATLVGHSMGGAVALELYRLAPNLVRRLILIETVLWPTEELKAAVMAIDELLRRQAFEQAFEAAESALFLPTDSAESKALYRETFSLSDKRTLTAVFADHLLSERSCSASIPRQIPVGYIAAEQPITALSTLASRMPGIRTGKTIGSGHFCPFLVPDQVNAMVDAFICTA